MIKDSGQIVWIILDAIKDIKVGKHKLAEFLKGSKSKDVANLSSRQGYGGLLWYDIATITGFIEQLEQMDFIARIRSASDDYYSSLELTDAGEKVLKEKIKIELQIINQEKNITVGASEKMTFDLLKAGKTIDGIAIARGLAISTIYNHLYRLVANSYLSSSEFLPQEVINQILEAKRKLPSAIKLKEIKEILPEDINYNQIRCVLADKANPIQNKPKIGDEMKIVEESLK